MSQRGAASESFVPFEPIPASTPKAGDAALKLKVVPKAEAGSVFAPVQTASPPHAHTQASTGNAAGKPIVTLQREGDRVTGIRIECTCGQVIELACSY